MRLLSALLMFGVLACLAASGAATARGVVRVPLYAVGYESKSSLQAALERAPAHIVHRFPRLRVVEVRPLSRRFASRARNEAGIAYVERVHPRRSAVEPALFQTSSGVPYEWQFAAARAEAVPADVLRAASRVTIAVIDTGADLQAPDLAVKTPQAYSLRTGSMDVRDVNGHGTFVAALAAGSPTNGEGIAGFGGDARLLVIKAIGTDGTMSDLEEASAIVYAVDHGARVINLSVGGTETSETEKRGIEYAAAHGVLLVAAAGNEFEQGNPVEYPAALLQPVGSQGRGGIGLAVGASNRSGGRASFSNVGSQISLTAPGEGVLSALSSAAPATDYLRFSLPGSTAGLYGFGSGTSFAAPEVAGAAALVMAANPLLHATEVADVLKQAASGRGSWTPELGFGVLDTGAAVSQAAGRATISLSGARSGAAVRLRWIGSGATAYRLSLREDNRAPRILLEGTTQTTSTAGVRRGHRTTFTVTALGAGGQALASASYVTR